MKRLHLDICHNHLEVKEHNEILKWAADHCKKAGSVLLQRGGGLTLLFEGLVGLLAAAAPC